MFNEVIKPFVFGPNDEPDRIIATNMYHTKVSRYVKINIVFRGLTNSDDSDVVIDDQPIVGDCLLVANKKEDSLMVSSSNFINRNMFVDILIINKMNNLFLVVYHVRSSVLSLRGYLRVKL